MKSSPQRILIVGIQDFVDFENVVQSRFNEIFYNDVQLAAMG